MFESIVVMTAMPIHFFAQVRSALEEVGIEVKQDEGQATPSQASQEQEVVDASNFELSFRVQSIHASIPASPKAPR